MADLQRELGVATQCGRCEPHARALLREEDEAQSLPSCQAA